MDITKKIKYSTIAEQLRDQKKYKIGVISTVNLNHATPAATYAHQTERYRNFEICLRKGLEVNKITKEKKSAGF